MQFDQLWNQIQDQVALETTSLFSLTVNLVIGGLLALYLRFLYTRFGASASDADSITRVFPLLTLVTTAVIAVVKSSLALSLGLVGALSIVRFRAAIKEPEELVYLFLCIAVGLSLGAEQPMLSLTLVAVATLFILVMSVMGTGRRQPRMMLTISGDSDPYFMGGERSVLETVERVAGKCSIHRVDIENGRGQVRVMLPRSSGRHIGRLIADLRNRLPECEFSYVNVNSAL